MLVAGPRKAPAYLYVYVCMCTQVGLVIWSLQFIQYLVNTEYLHICNSNGDDVIAKSPKYILPHALERGGVWALAQAKPSRKRASQSLSSVYDIPAASNA